MAKTTKAESPQPAKKKHYFILGNDASIFWDPSAKPPLKVVTKDKKAPEIFEGLISKRMDLALKHGHIIEVDGPEPVEEEVKEKKATYKPEKEKEKEELDEEEEEDDETKPLEKMTDEELLAYYKDEFYVTDKDIKIFNKLSKEEKVDFLTKP